MNDFAKILDAIDVFGRKKTTTAWVLIMIYAAYILLLDLSILLRFIVEGNTAGVWFFAFCTLFFAGGLIFQLFNKPRESKSDEAQRIKIHYQSDEAKRSTVYWQSTQPTDEISAIGDLWLDTANGNAAYAYTQSKVWTKVSDGRKAG